MNQCGSPCVLSCIGAFIGWWIVASLLLFITWNHVISMVAGLKKVKYWHPFLFVLTLSAFCIPSKMMSYKYGHHKGCCSRHCETSKGKGCPHHLDSESSDDQSGHS